MTMKFTLQTVGRIHFGIGEIARLAEEVKEAGKRALLVAGRHVLGNRGLVEQIGRLCEQGGAEMVVFDSPPSCEPDLETVDRGRQALRRNRCDFVIGIGGGSILDTAKAVAGLANETEPVEAYFNGRAIERPGLPWVAIPTTSGSGAEVTKNAVLSDPKRNVKRSIRDDRFYARAAIVDPQLTVSCPRRVTAESGMDALVQAIESYTSLGSNPLTDALAFEAARLILRSLPVACREGSNPRARADLALGSLMAGIALANARLGAVHGMAHPLGVRWRIPHGRICAILMPEVMRFNQSAVGDKYDKLSALVGKPIIEHFEQLREQLDIAGDLKAYGISRGELDWIVEESLPSGSLKMNPRPASADDLRRILLRLI